MRRIQALAALGFFLSVASPARAGTAECYVGFAGVTARHGGRVVQKACGGRCTFTVSVCVNEPSAGCDPARIDRVGARLMPRRGTVPIPVPQGTSRGCGEPMAIDVPLAPFQVRRHVELRAVALSGGRWDRDRLILRCERNASDDGCEEPGTTTTTPPPTTTLPASTTTSTAPPPTSTTLPSTGSLPRVDCEELRASVPQVGRLADFPPSIATPGTCVAGGASNYVIPSAADDPAAAEELHVISMQEGERPWLVFPQSYDTPRPIGTVTVRVQARPKPVALLLAAGEPVQWTILPDPDARLSRIVTLSGSAQELIGVPADVPVLAVPPEDVCVGGVYSWEVYASYSAADYAVLVREARAVTGLVETSFQACWEGETFTIPYWQGDPPVSRPPPLQGDESLPRESVRFPGCDDVTAESAYCLALQRPWAFDDQGAFTGLRTVASVVGLDSGRACQVTSTDADIGVATALAWRGEFLYACGSKGVTRIALGDGRWEALGLPCTAVTGDGSGLVVEEDVPGDDPIWPLARTYSFATLPDLLAGQFGGAAAVPWWEDRIALHDGTLFTANYSEASVVARDLATGAVVRPIALGGYDGDDLQGVSVPGDGSLVVSTPAPYLSDVGYLRVFDVTTGAGLCDVPTLPNLNAISCVSRRSEPARCPLETTSTTITPPTTTTTTIATTCPEWQPSCCYTGSDACLLTVRPDPSVTWLTSRCAETGGTEASGLCEAPCGPPAGCCRIAGCAAFAVFGNVDDLRPDCEASLGGVFAPGECAAGPS